MWRFDAKWFYQSFPFFCFIWRVSSQNELNAFFFFFKVRPQLYIKVLSHWRRRRRDCRDWSVAATRATRETRKWLALSPRRLLGDVSKGDNQFARKSRGRRRDVSGSRGDVSETSPQLRGRLRQLRPYLTGLETRWRLVGDSSLHWFRRRLRDVSWRRLAGSPGSRRNFKHVRFFFLRRLFPVSSRSWRRLRDLLETSPQRLLSLLGLQQVSETSRRCLRYLLETGKCPTTKIEHVSISRDSAETRLVSRRRRGDVSATSGDSSRHLVAT